MDSSFLNHLGSGLSAISSLPLGAHAIPVMLLIAGLLFWLAGGRFLKQLFVLMGIVSGAAVGAVVGPGVLPAQVGSIPGSYLAMGVGAVLGLVAALLAFRFAMGFCSAVILAAAASLGVGVYLSNQPDALPLGLAGEARERLTPGAADLTDQYKKAVDEYTKSKNGAGSSADATTADPSTSVSAAAADATRQFAQEVRAEAEALWDSTPEKSRLLLLAGAAAGALVGAAVGMAMPKRAASIITAVLGAGVALLAARWLAPAFEVPGRHLITDRGPIGLLGIWGALSLFGIIVQLQAGKKKSPPPKPDPKPE